MRLGITVKSVCLSVLIIVLFVYDAYAYLDPGTGSYFLQLMVAGLLGASFALKVFWKRIRSAFRSFFSKEKGDEEG
jgi:hypothetical protein